MISSTRSNLPWHPHVGRLATYVGQSRASARNVRVIAEARKGRLLVEAIGRKGRPVQFTVMRANLIQPQPDLFLKTDLGLRDRYSPRWQLPGVT